MHRLFLCFSLQKKNNNTEPNLNNSIRYQIPSNRERADLNSLTSRTNSYTLLEILSRFYIQKDLGTAVTKHLN